jgi:hypothetical protein
MTPAMPPSPIAQIASAQPASAAPGAARGAAAGNRATALPKSAVLPDPATLSRRETLPADQQAPLKRAVLVVPQNLGQGAKIALDDLTAYLKTVTGQPVLRVTAAPGKPLRLPAEADGATVIVLGQGGPSAGLTPTVPSAAEGYALEARQAIVDGKPREVVGLTGSDQMGLQYGIYRLMELSGKRFYSYTDAYTPERGTAVVPAGGYRETHAPGAQMAVRGFSPHLYHPIPLSIAFHNPSAEHEAMVKRYIDWCVQNGQNYVKFPMLELDQRNRFIPMKAGHENFDAWTPHARAIVEYAKQRGVKVSLNVGFASYASANIFAVNPIKAIYQSVRLELARRGHTERRTQIAELKQTIAQIDEKLGKASPRDRQKLVAERRKATETLTVVEAKDALQDRTYQALLKRYAADGRADIGRLVDKLMVVPWDEISWNMGTSEFTPTNDDLTIGWLNDAAAHMKRKYPGVRTTMTSHVPQHPHSEKYDESYYNLVRFADPEVGALVHTTHAYGLTDKAPVYGNEDFTHKLKLLQQSTPERLDLYYPETSYWVAHDVSVPLFLPVYMLNRRHDVELLKGIPHVDGQVDFTTAWEWGYWLNDYAVARMQHHPEESLTEILDGAFAPFGSARTPMVKLMNDAMRFQQEYLIEKGLIRHLQGFDKLTDFGAMAHEHPVLSQVLKGTNASPIRLKPATIMTWNAAQLAAFERGELADLGKVARTFQAQADEADALAPQVAPGALKYHDELADGFRINALRARQAHAALQAAVYARKAELTGLSEYRRRGEAALGEVRRVVDLALAQIRNREQDYRESPEYTHAKSQAKTMWSGRYLTPVHEGTYWKNTHDEVARLFEKPAFDDEAKAAPAPRR